MVSLNPLPPPPEIEDAKLTIGEFTNREDWLNIGLYPAFEIQIKDLPDMFGRAPIDYPSVPSSDIGPFSQPDTYEVRCNSINKLIEFYWDGVLIHTGIFPYWPDKQLPLGVQNYSYLYYPTGQYYRRMWNNIEDNIIYCYPIQRLKIE